MCVCMCTNILNVFQYKRMIISGALLLVTVLIKSRHIATYIATVYKNAKS